MCHRIELAVVGGCSHMPTAAPGTKLRLEILASMLFSATHAIWSDLLTFRSRAPPTHLHSRYTPQHPNSARTSVTFQDRSHKICPYYESILLLHDIICDAALESEGIWHPPKPKATTMQLLHHHQTRPWPTPTAMSMVHMTKTVQWYVYSYAPRSG